MKTETFSIPAHWICPLEYGSDSYGDMDDTEIAALEKFAAEVADTLGGVSMVNIPDEPYFATYHDARNLGILACDVLDVEFAYLPISRAS